MTQTIARIYASREDAISVVAALERNRVWDGHVYLVGAADGQSEDAVMTAIMKAYVKRDDARLYAPRLRTGGHLVVVHAPFGCAATAIHIMEQRPTIFSGVEAEAFTPTRWEPAAPFSSVFGFRLLVDCPAPMSAMWSAAPLTAGRASMSAGIGLPELVKHDTAASRALGLPLTARRAAPLSTLLGLPLLRNRSSVTDPW